VDWHAVDPAPLFETIREETTASDGESLVWAFEQGLKAARVDPMLLDHVATAALCLLAYRDRTTPRHVAEQLFRRSVADKRWNSRYSALI
jgi:hypothetical protein